MRATRDDLRCAIPSSDHAQERKKLTSRSSSALCKMRGGLFRLAARGAHWEATPTRLPAGLDADGVPVGKGVSSLGLRAPGDARRARQAALVAARQRRADPALERLARSGQPPPSLLAAGATANSSAVDWLLARGHRRVRSMALHLNLYQDVFHGAAWLPRLPLHVAYADSSLLVHRGNVLDADRMLQPPQVSWPASDQPYTLAMLSPDDNTAAPGRPLCHWLVVNARGSSGDARASTLLDYLPPMAPRGTGYHRYVFVLYHQSDEVDGAAMRLSDGAVAGRDVLLRRTLGHRDIGQRLRVAPAAMAFCQVAWAPSVDATFTGLSLGAPDCRPFDVQELRDLTRRAAQRRRYAPLA